LRDLGPPPHQGAKRFLARIEWVTNFGGVHRQATFASLVRAHVWRLLASLHYSLGEVARAIRGMSVAQGRLLADLQGFNLLARASHLRVPLAVFQGRHDVAAPPKLTQRYDDGLAAPQGKQLVWFEDSAHMPHVEEPDRFRQALIDFTSRGHEPPLVA
jgi:pimeloyl-ACP methyl ester carboxylesterase